MKNINLTENTESLTNINMDNLVFSAWSKNGLLTELERLDNVVKMVSGLNNDNIFSACLGLINYLDKLLKSTELELRSSYDEIGELKAKLKLINTEK